MKPDWKNAPEWANYLAMDSDGDWLWYKHEPIKKVSYWVVAKGPCAYAGTSQYWRETKEARPISSTKENTTC